MTATGRELQPIGDPSVIGNRYYSVLAIALFGANALSARSRW